MKASSVHGAWIADPDVVGVVRHLLVTHAAESRRCRGRDADVGGVASGDKWRQPRWLSKHVSEFSGAVRCLRLSAGHVDDFASPQCCLSFLPRLN